jgi:multimeric flavodoxin WrbA
MKVLAINSSPNMDTGNTARILGPFLEGMSEAGADVEVLYTRKLDINPCYGEYSCWLKTPGKCFQKDDMEKVLPKIGQADVLVFATPLYVDGMSGPLKNLMDRMIPGGQPFIEIRDGHCRHPGRGGGPNHGKVVLVSTCGFWELDNFDALIFHMKSICRNMGAEFAGALLRPHGGGLAMMDETGIPVADILDAAKEAGRQLVEDGKMAPETLAIVSRELVPRDVYVKFANEYFQQTLDALERK